MPACAPPALYPTERMKRLLLPAIASLLGAAFLGLLIYGVTHEAPSRTIDQALADGQQPSRRRPPKSCRSLSAAATARSPPTAGGSWC